MPVSNSGMPPRDSMSELTASERLIWTGQQLEPSSPLYNMAFAIEIDGAVDAAAFIRAFQRLVDDHDALRTTIRECNGRPQRVVLDSIDATVEKCRLGKHDIDDAAFAKVLESRTQRLLDTSHKLFDCWLVQRDDRVFVWYLNQHHLIADAWSVAVLHRRMSRLYEQECRSETPGAPSPALVPVPQFSAYLEHLESIRRTPRLTRALAYWDAHGSRTIRHHLYGDDRPGSGRTTRHGIRLDSDRTSRLRLAAASPPFRALTKEQSHFQLFATLLLAWMHRISSGAEVAIGTPWHNRTTGALRETAGLFVELFPVAVTIDDDETFVSLADKVARATRALMQHVVPGASASPGARAFGVVLNYITARFGEFAGNAVRVHWIHSGFGDRDHRVRLQVHDFDFAHQPVLDFDLDEQTFGRREREWAVRHFLSLFDALTQCPEQTIASVMLTTEDEERSFAVRGCIVPAGLSLDETLIDAALSHGHLPAVMCGGSTRTYSELHGEAARLAARLVEEGVTSDVVVGVALERTPELVVALLAIFLAGGTFVPLDPAFPDERLEFVVRDSSARIVVSSSLLEERIRRWGVKLVMVDESTDGIAGFPVRHRAVPVHTPANSLAYILYTSGSTGVPKGVAVSRAALSDYVHWAARRYVDRPGMAWPLFTSPAFDLTLTSILVPLVSGGAIVVYENDAGGGGLLVRRVLEEGRADVIKLTPSHLALVRDLDLSRSRIRRVIVGGEDLPTDAARTIHDALGGRAEILNEYGPTETTIACTVHRFDPAGDKRGSVPIGQPTDNVRIHVLDERGALLPRGAIGELFIGGPRLAQGYHNRPDLTSQTFVADPFVEGERLYRSGDLGRWLPNGALEYLGRRDEQVKVRGVRIELGEVEAALSLHPEIERCVAHISTARRQATHCIQCGLESAHPEARIDDAGICEPCHRFAAERENVKRYFGTMADLAAILANAKRDSTGEHDCLVLYSGGKDSTYALCRIVEMGARPLVMLFDNGFISGQAKDNVRRVVEKLDVDLVIGETPAMPSIFAESLARFSNVCNGCHKTIYTVAMNLAAARGIRHIITGLSRGQIFDTRLADLYRRGVYDPEQVDRIVLDARKAYHRMDDAVSRSFDTTLFDSDTTIEEIRFVDFYRYCDVTLDEILSYVASHTPWIRPTDTGRSTNCLINQAGIYVHRTERGFHNYAMPYSWDVRLGHKQRADALDELHDDLDPIAIRGMLEQVGYRPRPPIAEERRLVAYYTARTPIPGTELRRYLETRLPRDFIPSAFVRLDTIPLSRHGKIDRHALPIPELERFTIGSVSVAPRNDMEAVIAETWKEVLDLGDISVHDDFFELGGDSMRCIQIVAAARAHDVLFAPRDLFEHSTIAMLAVVATRTSTRAVAPVSSADQSELQELHAEFGDVTGGARS